MNLTRNNEIEGNLRRAVKYYGRARDIAQRRITLECGHTVVVTCKDNMRTKEVDPNKEHRWYRCPTCAGD